MMLGTTIPYAVQSAGFHPLHWLTVSAWPSGRNNLGGRLDYLGGGERSASPRLPDNAFLGGSLRHDLGCARGWL